MVKTTEIKVTNIGSSSHSIVIPYVIKTNDRFQFDLDKYKLQLSIHENKLIIETVEGDKK